jgi:HTH-type transcriptional regulator/antitoxin HigA
MRPIKTEADYTAACKRIADLIDLTDELEVWSILIADYEERHIPATLPTPVEAIRHRMAQQGLTHADLVPCFGSRSKVSEILSGKRQLSLAMIRRLYNTLGIPARVLLQDPKEE